MPAFKLDSVFTPTADQPKAIASLAEGVRGAARRSRCSPPTPRRPSGRRMFGDEVERLQHFDPLTGELIADDLEHVAIWPATHYNVKEGTIEDGVEEIGAS